VLLRLIARQAATQEDLAANDLALTKVQAEVTRLAAAKQEFDRSVKLDTGPAALHVQRFKAKWPRCTKKCGKAHRRTD